jgi:putative sterol carrier protein
MMAMRYGTVPIVHETGGLKDSVRAYKDFDGIGDGFAFSEYAAKNLYLAISEAVKVYFADEEMFNKLRRRCMTKDFSWDKSARAYNAMYDDITPGTQVVATGEVPFMEAYENLKHSIEANHKLNVQTGAYRKGPDYHRVFQFRLSGRSEGWMHAEFKGFEVEVRPEPHPASDVTIDCSYDNLLDMTRGLVSPGKLYKNGQLKIEGSLSKGFEIRHMLVPNRVG